MERPRRSHAQARAEMNAGILRAGRQQLAECGAANLSVREIARTLGVASSAVYRYISCRDELLTVLLIDSYNALADHVEAALADAGDAAADQLRSIGSAMRSWALEHRAEWALLYGSPVPGYRAPDDRTTTAGTRVLTRFIAVLADGSVRAKSPSGDYENFLAEAEAEFGLNADSATAAEALTAWTSLVGAISAEVFGHLGPELTAYGQEMLERLLDGIEERFGLAAAASAGAAGQVLAGS